MSEASSTGVATRILGKTGAKVSLLGLGGWHIGAIKDEAAAIRLMHSAVDEGITFFDNAWDYHDGRSEELMGKALSMDGKRDQVFLMTKNCERDYAGSLRNLEDSLRRLKTDHLDLWQFHELVYDNDPDWIFERGGIKAAIEAQQAGKVRFIGFTGHKDPRIHLRMLAKPFAFDTTQMPINVMDAHYRSFLNDVAPVCHEKNVAIIGMKSLGGGYPNGRFLSHAGLNVEECFRYSLSQDISVLVTGINTPVQLKQDLDLVRKFKPLSEAEADAFRDRVREAAGDGRHELFKSTTEFDGPYHRKQHGFAAAG